MLSFWYGAPPRERRIDWIGTGGAYPWDHWALPALPALPADGGSARQGTRWARWSNGSGLLIRGFRIRVPGGRTKQKRRLAALSSSPKTAKR